MGVDSLSDIDLISVLIGSGVKGMNFTSLSKKVRNVLESGSVEYEDLKKIKG